MELECRHCGYTWDYNGSAPFYACCPRCLYRVKIPGSSKDPWVITDEELGMEE